MSSYIYISADLSEPKFLHAWHADDGTVYANVRAGGASLTFDSAADARAAARACTEAADAHDKLTTEAKEAKPHGQPAA